MRVCLRSTGFLRTGNHDPWTCTGASAVRGSTLLSHRTEIGNSSTRCLPPVHDGGCQDFVCGALAGKEAMRRKPKGTYDAPLASVPSLGPDQFVRQGPISPVEPKAALRR